MWKCVSFVVFAIVCMVAGETTSEESFWCVMKDEHCSPRQMMKEYLNRLGLEYLKKSKEDPMRYPSEEQLESYKENRRKMLWDLVGGELPKTPLHATVVRTGNKSTYRYEVLYYESLPGVYVTSVLYLPLSEPPYPVVLIPCGHALKGKGYESYQKLGILLAQHGIAGFIYDPPGQGERITYLDDTGKPVIWGTAEHTVFGLGCILLGTNYARFEIWDGIRAIDYLISREDIIKDKIGCAGNSGGGTQTTYLLAFEPRIVAGAPSCYITSFEKLLTTIGPQDAEQNIFSQVKFGFDHSDFLFLHAPKPVLICCATRDFFDIEGTWSTFREVKRFYARYRGSNRCDLLETPTEHGLNATMREGIVMKMLLWLRGEIRDVVEHIDDADLLAPEEYNVCKSGNVREIPECKTIEEVNIELERSLQGKRREFWDSQSLEVKQKKVAELIGVSMEQIRDKEPVVAEENQVVSSEVGEVRHCKGITTFILQSDEGIYLPGILFEGEDALNRVIVYTHPEGKTKVKDVLQEYLSDKWHVCALDLRGVGETAPNSSENDITSCVGADWQDFFRAYLIGKSYVGMRVEDYMAVINYLRRRYGDSLEVRLVTSGVLCVPAVHTAFLMLPERVGLELAGLISWAEIVKCPRIRGQIVNAVHGVLCYYDVPDLLAELNRASTYLQLRDGNIETF